MERPDWMSALDDKPSGPAPQASRDLQMVLIDGATWDILAEAAKKAGEPTTQAALATAIRQFCERHGASK